MYYQYWKRYYKLAESALMRVKKAAQNHLDILGVLLVVINLNKEVVLINRKACETVGYEEEEIIGKNIIDLFVPEDMQSKVKNFLNKLITNQKDHDETIKFYDIILNKKGERRAIEWNAILLRDELGKITGILSLGEDVKERVEMKNMCIQAKTNGNKLHMQKMESIDRLAGGMAHRFNNLLCGILGFSELALLEIPKDHPSRERIELVLGLGEKAAFLINQLLAFSRKQLLTIENININDIVSNMEKILKRIIGENIVLELKPATAIKDIMADQSQIEQVLLNFAVNARDAMPVGGILTIETANVSIKDNNIEQIDGIRHGKYVKLVVSDNGCGMDSNVLENIFEPFYTTKDFEKGTGLGLSTVYGIIKQHNGFIDVSSKINKGTTFNIYLPVADTDVNPSSTTDL